MITLAVLTALGRENEIAMHVRAALRNGLTPAEIGEVLLHTAIYAGVPAANAAFAIAQRGDRRRVGLGRRGCLALDEAGALDGLEHLSAV